MSKRREPKTHDEIRGLMAKVGPVPSAMALSDAPSNWSTFAAPTNEPPTTLDSIQEAIDSVSHLVNREKEYAYMRGLQTGIAFAQMIARKHGISEAFEAELGHYLPVKEKGVGT